MIQASIGDDASIIAWARARYPRCPTDKATAIGITDDGEMICAVIYSGLLEAVNVNMSIVAASPRWALSRTVIRILFRYPFNQLGVQRVTATVAKKNDRSRKLVSGMGFTLEGTLRRGWDGRQHALVYGMLKDECRWL